MALRLGPLLWLGAIFARSRAGELGTLDSEAAVLERLEGASLPLSAVEAADVGRLVHRGWYDAVRKIVQRSHAGTEDEAVWVTSQVRQAVQAEKNSLDDLIRVLDRNYGKAAEVSPASQWAQNSTHVFLAVKFAQRWNAPGALEVGNQTVSITSCCFNFTAFGEHSMIRRRYHLSWELFQPLVVEASSWSWAAAGRMTVIFAKAKPAHWPRLMSGPTAAPKNLGIWHDMQDKWTSDLEKFAPLTSTVGAKKGKAAGKSAAASPDTKKATAKSRRAKAAEKDGEEAEKDDALDREVELVADCPKASYSGTTVAELCGKVWPKVVEDPRVQDRRWLVELYSSQGDGDAESMKRLMPVWRRLADTFPAMVPGGRVGSLDCGLEGELCRKLGVSMEKLPQVRRFVGGGAGDVWTGDLMASIEDFAAFGGSGDRSEL